MVVFGKTMDVVPNRGFIGLGLRYILGPLIPFWQVVSTPPTAPYNISRKRQRQLYTWNNILIENIKRKSYVYRLAIQTKAFWLYLI